MTDYSNLTDHEIRVRLHEIDNDIGQYANKHYQKKGYGYIHDPEFVLLRAQQAELMGEMTRRANEIQKTTVPHRPCHTEGHAIVWLPFSEYELANIAAMFKAILPYRYATEEERKQTPQITTEEHPFAVFNSGDWTGVVADRFVETVKEYCPNVQGNQTPEYYREYWFKMQEWKRQRAESSNKPIE
jgi:hypothetical protein